MEVSKVAWVWGIARPQAQQYLLWDGDNFADMEAFIPEGYGTTLVNNHNGTITVTNGSTVNTMHIGDSVDFLGGVHSSEGMQIIPEPTGPLVFVIAEEEVSTVLDVFVTKRPEVLTGVVWTGSNFSQVRDFLVGLLPEIEVVNNMDGTLDATLSGAGQITGTYYTGDGVFDNWFRVSAADLASKYQTAPAPSGVSYTITED
jgi:hypothetical protein